MAKYFFDAVGASFEGSLTYKQVEGPKDIKKHPAALNEAKEKAKALVTPFLNRKKVLFVCTENACRSQMASAFTQYHAGDKIEVESAGSEPAKKINPLMEKAMKEKGIDMAYRKPKSLEEAVLFGKPDLIVSMGCKDVCPQFPGVPNEEWNVPDPAGKSIEFMRQIRDDIEERVKKTIGNFEPGTD
jgi:protein-tyrosine-phosphatase